MGLAAVLAFMMALYFQGQATLFAGQASELSNLLDQKVSQVETLKQIVQQKDAEIRDMSAVVARLKGQAVSSRAELSALRREAETAQSEANAKVSALRDSLEDCQALEAEVNELRRRLADAGKRAVADEEQRRACNEMDSLRRRLADMDSRTVGCEAGKGLLAAALNVSRAESAAWKGNLQQAETLIQDCLKRTEELERQAGHATDCCESVPMCNLCRIKKDR